MSRVCDTHHAAIGPSTNPPYRKFECIGSKDPLQYHPLTGQKSTLQNRFLARASLRDEHGSLKFSRFQYPVSR